MIQMREAEMVDELEHEIRLVNVQLEEKRREVKALEAIKKRLERKLEAV
ncbi:hypothetical protein LCGC14_2021310 [marine sediment metagenome]|uniref:Uncharacterized protein n=1 Tax=marine sediment metagenome TaxID=412755 RepID=A0A0F9HAT9_9ZZZZ